MTAGPWTEAPADTPDAGRTTYELSADEAVAWGRISEEVGTRLLPVLDRLTRALPSVTAAMVSTADGFSLCALGLPGDRVERVSAMTGALHSMAASASTGGDGSDAPTDLLTITSGTATTVVMAVAGMSVGASLLWLTGRHDTLGAMISRARAAVGEIEALGL
jgi:predicted regulator of Ras-like GTPase activity (Roadblock/LC7/MglB family)